MTRWALVVVGARISSRHAHGARHELLDLVSFDQHLPTTRTQRINSYLLGAGKVKWRI